MVVARAPGLVMCAIADVDPRYLRAYAASTAGSTSGSSVASTSIQVTSRTTPRASSRPWWRDLVERYQAASGPFTDRRYNWSPPGRSTPCAPRQRTVAAHRAHLHPPGAAEKVEIGARPGGHGGTRTLSDSRSSIAGVHRDLRQPCGDATQPGTGRRHPVRREPRDRRRGAVSLRNSNWPLLTYESPKWPDEPTHPAEHRVCRSLSPTAPPRGTRNSHAVGDAVPLLGYRVLPVDVASPAVRPWSARRRADPPCPFLA